MIPNPESPEGIALGDEILAFAMANAARFGLQDAIWRGTYGKHRDNLRRATLPVCYWSPAKAWPAAGDYAAPVWV